MMVVFLLLFHLAVGGSCLRIYAQLENRLNYIRKNVRSARARYYRVAFRKHARRRVIRTQTLK